MEETSTTPTRKPNWLAIFITLIVLGLGICSAFAYTTQSALTKQQSETTTLKAQLEREAALRGGRPTYLEGVSFYCNISDRKVKEKVEECLAAFHGNLVGKNEAYPYLTVKLEGDRLSAAFDEQHIYATEPGMSSDNAYLASRDIATQVGVYRGKVLIRNDLRSKKSAGIE